MAAGIGSRMSSSRYMFQQLSLALAELYIFIVCLFTRADLQLHDRIRQREVDSMREYFIEETFPTSLDIGVTAAPITLVPKETR